MDIGYTQGRGENDLGLHDLLGERCGWDRGRMKTRLSVGSPAIRFLIPALEGRWTVDISIGGGREGGLPRDSPAYAEHFQLECGAWPEGMCLYFLLLCIPRVFHFSALYSYAFLYSCISLVL